MDAWILDSCALSLVYTVANTLAPVLSSITLHMTCPPLSGVITPLFVSPLSDS